MPKILSQAGISLADAYDVEGSIAGVDQLISQDVSLVHEMGAQMFSERCLAFYERITTGAIAQNIAFDVEATIAFPDSPNRILKVLLVSDTNRITLAQVSQRTVVGEMPLIIWDAADDVVSQMRYRIGAAATATVFYLRPGLDLTPTMLMRTGDEGIMPTLFLRGLTSGFGAGVVTLDAFIHVARANPTSPQPGHPSSHGLPRPSW